jgi:hypothetical protein
MLEDEEEFMANALMTIVGFIIIILLIIALW